VGTKSGDQLLDLMNIRWVKGKERADDFVLGLSCPGEVNRIDDEERVMVGGQAPIG
jgi:hypothetical protein